ncbi:MAG: hypothetical protein HN341_13150, partial [Verrucomicrobia bacterium]|nr:hypothetical protein [Verrucomicrobiota bacterium]
MRNVILSAGLCVGLLASGALAESALKTKHLSIGLKDGAIVSLKATASGRDYLAAGQPAPLLQVRVAGALHAPDGMDWDAKTEQMTLRFSKAGVEVVVATKAKPTHVTLTVLSVTPKEKVELIVWGPYPTTINRTIGEMVGVVRDQTFGIGIQVLNPKTMGGYPT